MFFFIVFTHVFVISFLFIVNIQLPNSIYLNQYPNIYPIWFLYCKERLNLLSLKLRRGFFFSCHLRRCFVVTNKRTNLFNKKKKKCKNAFKKKKKKHFTWLSYVFNNKVIIGCKMSYFDIRKIIRTTCCVLYFMSKIISRYFIRFKTAWYFHDGCTRLSNDM